MFVFTVLPLCFYATLKFLELCKLSSLEITMLFSYEMVLLFQNVSGKSTTLKSCDISHCKQEIITTQIHSQPNSVIGRIEKLTLLWEISAQIFTNYGKILRLISTASMYSFGSKSRKTQVQVSLLPLFCDLMSHVFLKKF